MDKYRILVVDDAKTLLVMMKQFLEGEGYNVILAYSAEEALPIINKEKINLVLMDIKMPGMSGLEALAQIKKIDPKLSVIMMTAYGTTQTAIEAMKLGAYDYVTKPFNMNELKVLIRKALEAGRLMREAVSYQVKEDSLSKGICIIGKSLKMQEIYKTIGKVAESSATVLIRGESGTGKELVTRAIYQNSSRKDQPFLAVNCAAIPDSLLESELFGHEKGAFTGAINKRIGKFQQCDAGTIFLDEIGDMSLSTQTKILRVLQEHTFQPVGSEKTVEVNVRVIASTNKDLWKAIERNEFREDLYYRLKVITIYMPPLRQRSEDIPLLVDYFIQKFNAQFNKDTKKVPDDVMSFLKGHEWPGNVRELENAIQTAVIMSKGDVLLLDNFPIFASGLPVQAAEPCPPGTDYEKNFQGIVESMLKDSRLTSNARPYKAVMEEMEKTLLKLVLDEAGKNKVKAAKMLGISRNTLRSRLKSHHLS